MANFTATNQFVVSRSKREAKGISPAARPSDDVATEHAEIMARAETSYDFDKMTKFTTEMSREEIFKKIMGGAYNAAALTST